MTTDKNWDDMTSDEKADHLRREIQRLAGSLGQVQKRLNDLEKEHDPATLWPTIMNS